MTTKTTPIRSLSLAILAPALLSPLAALSAPGTLSDSPLFLSNAVEPNILFLLDDSGSMRRSLMTEEVGGLMALGCGYRFAGPEPVARTGQSVPTEDHLITLGVAAPYGGVWRAWNRDYNRLYYDPRLTYTPWPGVNSGGVTFANSNPKAALYNPHVPADGSIDLTALTTYDTDYCPDGLATFTVKDYLPAHYYAWADSDGDGVVDAEDLHAPIKIIPSLPIYVGSVIRADCASAPLCSYAEEIQNFANWFTYYRKRDHVAKAAYGQVIAGASNSRMGLVSLHDHNSVNTAITPMNADPSTGNKGTLLRSLYNLAPSGGTPFRAALDDAGKYLGCNSNSFFASCPALSVASGGECQQNFTVAMTDGFYNGSFPASTRNPDGDNDSPWDSGDTGPYGDARFNTLADIAMKYYEDDLRPGVANNLNPAPGGVDENTAQHMVTFAVAFGVSGEIAAMPPNTTDPFTWPPPDTDARKIDDLRHAAWNGRGEFLSARNPLELVLGLRAAIQSLQGRIGSAASVAFNTGSLSTNSEVYLALFNSERWGGDLLAFDLNPNTGDISAVPSWSASTQLNVRNLGATPRTILTYDGTDGIAFQWATLTTAQKDDLRTNSSGVPDNDATGMARLGYLRGDRGCEVSAPEACFYSDGTNIYNTKSMRQRSSRMGDIIHSGPVFAGAPESNWPDVAPFPGSLGNTYTEFRDAFDSRPGVVYVGGNDGMLHGFAQSNGEEVLGYVPNELYSTTAADGLHYLTDPSYVHRYYVDLTASIADAYIKTASFGSTTWKTILIGGLRGGGEGLFALDITDPAGFSEDSSSPANTVMWEFTNNDDADLGHTFSRPSIVPMDGGSGTIRWAAIFGNGYNDSGSGEAKLFVAFLEAGLDGTWTAGSDFVKITTGVGDTINRNGLSTAAVIDSDGDGLADRAYAGDLAGNLWAFNLSGSTPGSWDVAYKQGTTPKPLFVTPVNQQITSTPVIVRNSTIPTTGANQPNLMVVFGTGQYLTTGDTTTTDTQSMYGVWDDGSKELDRTALIGQTISTGLTTEFVVGRTLTDLTVDYSVSHGWYIDLPDIGERLITDPVIRGDLVFFNTMRPDTNPCNFGGGGWLMVAKWINGGNPDEIAFDLNGDGLLDTLDTIGGEAAVGVEVTGIATSPVNLADKRYTSTTETTGGSSIDVTDILDLGGLNTGRLSWEELTP